MKDYMVKATANDGQIRAVAVVTTELVEEARESHDTFPTASAALGRALTGTLLLGSTLKGADTLTLRILGDGPLGGIITQVGSDSLVRGYVQEPHTHLPATPQGKLDVGGAVGKGFLYLTKELGIGEPYTGSVPLVSGEIAQDITEYLATSEQIPSVCALGVLVDTDNSIKAAGGFLIQVMPGAEEDTIKAIEDQLATVKPISQMVAEGLKPEEVLQEILGKSKIKILDKREVGFKCTCSRERLEKVLISLGREELRAMIEEHGQAELCCHFCNKFYEFSGEDINNLLAEIEKDDNSAD